MERGTKLAVGCVVAALVGLGLVLALGYLSIRRKLVYKPTGPVPQIQLPSYPQPVNNGFADLAAAAAQLHAYGDAIGAAYELPWDQPLDTQTADSLAPAAGPLEAARKALKRECLQPRPTTANTPSPHLAHLRLLARLMVVRGRALEREGRSGEAARLYIDALKLDPICSRNGALIHGLTGIAITQITAPNLSRCIGSGKLSEADLEWLTNALAKACGDAVPYHEWLAIEWVIVDSGLAAGAGQAPKVMADGARLEIREKIGKAIEAAKDPNRTEPYEIEPATTALAGMVLPVLGSSSDKVRMRDASLAGLQAHAAVQLYMVRKGEQPDSLADLVSDCVAAVPIDPFDKQPLRYQRTGDSYVVYSVGPDRADDGGTDRIDGETEKGDLIIWPWGRAYKPREQASPPTTSGAGQPGEASGG